MPYLAIAITLICFVIGFISSFLPILPGTFITWLGIAVHKFWMTSDSVSWTFFWVATGLMVLAQILDLAFSWWGARRFGASWKGAAGALLGGLIGGIILNIPGLIIGPVVGAVVFELLNNRSIKEASRAGFGTIIGGIVAFVLKLGITCALIGGFLGFLPG